jgi:ribonuclease HII
MLPDFSFEKKLWEKGFSLIIGVDEVGRGALAGPVIAGACALIIGNKESRILKKEENLSYSPNSIFHILNSVLDLGINDSKKLSPKKREALVTEIGKYFYTGIGEAQVGFINMFGIRQATERAMRAAVISLLYKVLDKDDNLTSKTALSQEKIRDMKPYLLIDAFQVRYVPVIGLQNQLAIIKGDEKSISIAAASILAKVYRDTLMKKLSVEFPLYGWDKNSAYGTASHISAIRQYGICTHHRTKFVDGIINS